MITKKWLQQQVTLLNTVLGRPIEQFAFNSIRYNIGHIYLDHNRNGYSLEEQTSEQGAVHVMCHRMPPKEMNMYIHGLLRGIALRDANKQG